jgi:hypothetical protein
MRPPGSFKFASRNRAFEDYLDPQVRGSRRARRILASLREEILEGGAGDGLRIRRVFSTPREVFRLELELPELGYQRTTLLDREALEELLATDGVRARVRKRLSLG